MFPLTGAKGGYYFQCTKLLLSLWKHGLYSWGRWLQEPHLHSGISQAMFIFCLCKRRKRLMKTKLWNSLNQPQGEENQMWPEGHLTTSYKQQVTSSPAAKSGCWFFEDLWLIPFGNALSSEFAFLWNRFSLLPWNSVI